MNYNFQDLFKSAMFFFFKIWKEKHFHILSRFYFLWAGLYFFRLYATEPYGIIKYENWVTISAAIAYAFILGVATIYLAFNYTFPLPHHELQVTFGLFFISWLMLFLIDWYENDRFNLIALLVYLVCFYFCLYCIFDSIRVKEIVDFAVWIHLVYACIVVGYNSYSLFAFIKIATDDAKEKYDSNSSNDDFDSVDWNVYLFGAYYFNSVLQEILIFQFFRVLSEVLHSLNHSEEDNENQNRLKEANKIFSILMKSMKSNQEVQKLDELKDLISSEKERNVLIEFKDIRNSNSSSINGHVEIKINYEIINRKKETENVDNPINPIIHFSVDEVKDQGNNYVLSNFSNFFESWKSLKSTETTKFLILIIYTLWILFFAIHLFTNKKHGEFTYEGETAFILGLLQTFIFFCIFVFSFFAHFTEKIGLLIRAPFFILLGCRIALCSLGDLTQLFPFFIEIFGYLSLFFLWSSLHGKPADEQTSSYYQIFYGLHSILLISIVITDIFLEILHIDYEIKHIYDHGDVPDKFELNLVLFYLAAVAEEILLFEMFEFLYTIHPNYHFNTTRKRGKFRSLTNPGINALNKGAEMRNPTSTEPRGV